MKTTSYSSFAALAAAVEAKAAAEKAEETRALYARTGIQCSIFNKVQAALEEAFEAFENCDEDFVSYQDITVSIDDDGYAVSRGDVLVIVDELVATSSLVNALLK